MAVGWLPLYREGFRAHLLGNLYECVAANPGPTANRGELKYRLQ